MLAKDSAGIKSRCESDLHKALSSLRHFWWQRCAELDPEQLAGEQAAIYQQAQNSTPTKEQPDKCIERVAACCEMKQLRSCWCRTSWFNVQTEQEILIQGGKKGER